MRRHQPTAIGEHRIGAGQLQGSDLHNGLTDGGTGHVLRDPWSGAGIGPAAATGSPVFISHQADALFPADLNAGFLLEAQLISRLFEGLGADPNAHLVEEGVAGETQGIRIADVAEASPVVIREAMAAVGDAGRGVELGVRRELARLHARHRRHRLPGAAGVIGIHGPGQQWLLRIGEEGVVLLLGGDQLGEEIRIKTGTAGQSQHGTRCRLQRHHGATGLVGQRLLRHPLQIQVEGEHQILSCLRRSIAQVALDLAHGIHLEHLAAPLPTQMALVSRFNTGATNAVADLVSLLRQDFEFAFRDRLGVAEGMGRQGSIGIGAQDVDIHLGTPQPQGLFPEAQHLFRLEIEGQRGAVTIPIQALLPSLVEQIRLQAQQPCQAIPQIRPVVIADQTRLKVQGVSEFAGGQHPAFAIKQPTANGRAGHQTDAIFIRQFTKARPLQQLHPDQAADHGAAEQQHQHQQHQGLLTQTGLTLLDGTGHSCCGSGKRRRNSSRRSSIRRKVGSKSSGPSCSTVAGSSTETETGITGLPSPGLTASSCSRTSRATGSPS